MVKPHCPFVYFRIAPQKVVVVTMETMCKKSNYMLFTLQCGEGSKLILKPIHFWESLRLFNTASNTAGIEEMRG